MSAPFEENNYIHHFQNQKFQDSESDPFQTSSVRRKCLAQTFHASITLGSNDTTCALLQENLRSYAEIVDKNDADSVNNYAKSVMALVSNSKCEHQQWKSGLRTKDAASYVEHIPSTHCTLSAKPDKSCQSSEVTMEDIQILLDNLSMPDNVPTEPPKRLPQSNMKPKLHTQSVPVINSNAQYNPVTSKPGLATGGLFSKPIPELPQPQHVRPNHFFKKPPAPPVRPQSNYTHDSNVVQPVASTSRFPNTLERDVRENTAPRQMFVSAREELGVQNLKKYGCRGGNSSTSSTPSYGNHNYGEQKKSLGTRRGAFNKFVPPVRPGDDSDANTRKRTREEDDEPMEEVDERLKNIDPKMVELIRSEIMDSGASVAWDDIAGLEYAKATIQEIVVWPLLRPDIFTGLRRPPKGILLFGPPGTGKTLIGKCIASQSRSTFFSISASSLTSKWIGDGEKMVRALFAVARCHQPAVVFIDEIDSLLTQRSDTEHESSRRIKTEFLVQLDGATTGEEDRILVVGATNRPQELDEAARRRLVKRLYIPLPEAMARRQIVERLMLNERHSLTLADMDEVARLTDGYSGSDMKNLCQEASLGPIRSLGFSMHIEHIQPDQVRGVDITDFQAALSRVRASVSPGDLDSYIKWDKTYGSGGTPSN